MMIPPDIEEIARKIKTMEIRGAALIAETAVSCLKSIAERSRAKETNEFIKELDIVARRLLDTRPTAVSLPNAIRYVMYRVLQAEERGEGIDSLREITVKACDEFIKNAKEAIGKIAEIGARRISDGDVIMTHCHSTAVVAILKAAKAMGKSISVYATETRPLYQGRLTAEQLLQNDIPVTLIVDSASRYFMKRVDKVLVGADAVAANGAVVNKIGTSMVALAAHEARTLFFVAAETFKFSPETIIGELIKIEERPKEEILPPEIAMKGLKGIEVRNPAFDVTPPDYIDLIITERGIIPPQAALTVIQQELGPIIYEKLGMYSTYRES
ncbi:ribose 1,5-bisphosphate isomerase [Candidatus Bathyarchaeota archaeon]|nr:ribose 1,5-bisphosphate isomerase [Candidatus Bathyarchaeota archaeon]MBS7627709.1 ribose 1,5-bisphosphate isomerase [Candidatus Bathyarchaeota archaeon]